MVTSSDSLTWDCSPCFLRMLSYLLTWGPTSGLQGTESYCLVCHWTLMCLVVSSLKLYPYGFCIVEGILYLRSVYVSFYDPLQLLGQLFIWQWILLPGLLERGLKELHRRSLEAVNQQSSLSPVSCEHTSCSCYSVSSELEINLLWCLVTTLLFKSNGSVIAQGVKRLFVPFVVSLRWDTGLCLHGACTNSFRKCIGIPCVLLIGIAVDVVLLQPHNPVILWLHEGRGVGNLLESLGWLGESRGWKQVVLMQKTPMWEMCKF